MSHPDTTSKDAVFQWRGIPQPGQLLPLGLQHVVAAVVGVITPAILIADTCGLSSADKPLMIQVSLILTALATLLQLFPIFGRLGSGLPVVMGVSFAYVPSMQAIAGIGGHEGVANIAGAMLVGGAVALVVGLFLKKIRKFFPPIITGTVVFSIGLSLYPTAIKYMAGGEGKLWWTTAGALVIGSVRNVLNLLHVSVYMQNIIVGVIIIGVVAFSMLMKLRRDERTAQFIAAAEAEIH